MLRVFLVLPAVLGLACSTPEQSDEEFSFVVLPDTQIYSFLHPEIFDAQTQWIADNASDFDFVIHEGDIVESNNDVQWERAQSAMGRLTNRIPYVLAIGNHDMGTGGSADNRGTLMNDYFKLSDQMQEPSFLEAFEAGKLENTAHRFETVLGSVIVLSLEFGPRDEVITWADQLLTNSDPSIPVFIVTHAHTYADNTRYDEANVEQMWSPKSYGLANTSSVNDAQDLWNQLIEKHTQIHLVLSGHVLFDGTGQISTTRADGKMTHEILANYQMNEMGGEGFLRIMRVTKDRIFVTSYSPYLDSFKREADQEFELQR